MAVDTESSLNLKADFSAVAQFVTENKGLISDNETSGIYWLTLHPKDAPAESYIARVEWESYPHMPPSVSYVNEVGGSESTMSAWPTISGYRAPKDICKPFTAEGYKAHPEWVNGSEAWVTKGNPFLFVVNTLQADLDYSYTGRHDQ